MASKGGFMFTVGKVDAGMAILIGERAHLIEFPSILLPNGCTSGSIVNISVHRNVAEEKTRRTEFWSLQDQIYETFGVEVPETPKLVLRNVTQTSVTLEWPAIKLATATLRSLDLYRNGVRLSTIPTPLQQNSTKISGLQLDADYTFQLILRTSAGTYPSNVIKLRTHKISDTSGISVCFGNVADLDVLENAKAAVQEMGAKWSDKIQIDTTHFVCNTPATAGAGANSSSPGVEYQRALQLSIPVVQPQWILACRAEHRMVPIANYYLGASASASASPPASGKPNRPGSMASVPTPPTTGPSSQHGSNHRASLPVRIDSRSPPSTAFVNQDRSNTPMAQEPDEEQIAMERAPTVTKLSSPPAANGKARGQMNKDFKFPSPTAEAGSISSVPLPEPSPPPIIEKDRMPESQDSISEVGETEEVDLS